QPTAFQARIQSQMVRTSNPNLAFPLGQPIYPLDDPTLPNAFVNLTDPSAFPILPGDYFEIRGSGVLRQVTGSPIPETPLLNNATLVGPWGVYRIPLSQLGLPLPGLVNSPAAGQPAAIPDPTVPWGDL